MKLLFQEDVMLTLLSAREQNTEKSYKNTELEIKLSAAELEYFLKFPQRSISVGELRVIVTVCLRSLRVRTAEEKDIPRPSRELMSCK